MHPRTRHLFHVTLLLLAALVLPAPLPAADPVNRGNTVPLASDYNLQSTSYIYCYTVGKTGLGIRGDWQLGWGKIVTSGSSTTTTSNTASGAALTSVAAGDELTVYQTGSSSGLPLRRYVTAAASVDSVTVNAAWDLTGGYTYWVRHRTCSTAATAGWFRVSDLNAFSIEIKIATFASASIDTIVQCRADDAAGEINTAYTQHYTSTGADVYVVAPQLGPVGDECRIGLKTTTPTDVQAVTLNLMTR